MGEPIYHVPLHPNAEETFPPVRRCQAQVIGDKGLRQCKNEARWPAGAPRFLCTNHYNTHRRRQDGR